jgi:cell division transport system permease protein
VQRVRLLTSEAWRSLGANLSTTVASAVTVLIAMFLLGLFISFFTLARSWSDHVKDEIVVKVYFKNNATTAQMNSLARSLEQNQYVKQGAGGIVFVSKAAALEKMKKQEPTLVANLTSNPLPNSLEVTPNQAENVDKLYESIITPVKPPGVDTVNDGKRTSHVILDWASTLDWSFAVASIVLLFASVLLIANTIRLSIFSRRREIEVMKLVGATNWFVRGPFMVEGLLCGALGSVLAIAFLLIGKVVAVPHILGHLSLKPAHALAFPVTALILLCMGLGIGALGSGLTIRRFLRV